MPVFSENCVKKIGDLEDKIVAFSVMRNEMLRVEAWIAHYRSIGITQFYVIDNGSTDGTYEFLSGQPDVITTRTQASFQRSNFGVEWLNRFCQIIGPNKWALYADADELMVYEGWPKSPIADMVDKAEALECNAVIGFLLDMYPDGPLDSCRTEIGKNPFSAAPCFDSDYEFKFLPTCSMISVIGGPRVRLLSSMEREASVTWFDLFVRRQTAHLMHLAPAFIVPTILSYLPKWMPELKKTPLTQGGADFRYGNNHGGSGARYYKQNVVVCHFKFLHDFYDRVRAEVNRKEHYLNAAEYIMYSNLIKKHGSLDLRYFGTQRFISSEQLVSLGLIREMAWNRVEM